MTYTEWRDELKSNLLSVSESERKRVLEYYAEAYADRREAGFSEQEVIAQFGAPYDAAQRILHEDGGDSFDSTPQEPPVRTESPLPEVSKESPAPRKPAAEQSIQAQPVEQKKPQKKEKKKPKTLWIVLLCVAIVIPIVAIILITSFALNGWLIEPEFEMAQYTAEGEIVELKIDNAVGRIKTEFYDGDKMIVDYPVSNRYTMTIEEKAGTLKVNGLNRRHWYNFTVHMSSFPETVVKIPQSTVLKLDVTVNAGSVTLAEGNYAAASVKVNAGSINVLGMTCPQFDCEVNAGSIFVKSLDCASFDCEVSAGSINVERLVCPLIQIDVSAGHAGVKVQGRKEEYTILVDKSAGSCNVASQTGTDPEKKIDIDVSAGSVSVNFI